MRSSWLYLARRSDLQCSKGIPIENKNTYCLHLARRSELQCTGHKAPQGKPEAHKRFQDDQVLWYLMVLSNTARVCMHLTRHPKLQVWDVQGGGLDHNIGSVGSQGAEDTASYIAGSQIWKPLASSSAGSICARAGIRKASKLETMLTMRSQLKATA